MIAARARALTLATLCLAAYLGRAHAAGWRRFLLTRVRPFGSKATWAWLSSSVTIVVQFM